MKKVKLARFICLAFLVSINIKVSVNASAQSELTATIMSETAVLIDGNTGQVLFDKDMHRQMYPASITKIMTAVLALENGNMDDTVVMSDEAVFSVGRDTSHICHRFFVHVCYPAVNRYFHFFRLHFYCPSFLCCLFLFSALIALVLAPHGAFFPVIRAVAVGGIGRRKLPDKVQMKGRFGGTARRSYIRLLV